MVFRVMNCAVIATVAAGVVAGLVAAMAATPASARAYQRGIHFRSGGFHAHRAVRFDLRVGYGYGRYGRIAGPSARAVGRIYRLGYGGYLRYRYENGAFLPYYYNGTYPGAYYLYPSGYAPATDPNLY